MVKINLVLFYCLLYITVIASSMYWTVICGVMIMAEDMISACDWLTLIPVKASVCSSIVHTNLVSHIATLLTLQQIKWIGLL